MTDYNPCQGCEFFNKPYWSVVSPCENCPRQATSGYITTTTTTVSTADLVPVVRCRDCKHSMLWRKPTNKVIGECAIRKWNSDDEQFCLIGADDYCSYGERRADE